MLSSLTARSVPLRLKSKTFCGAWGVAARAVKGPTPLVNIGLYIEYTHLRLRSAKVIAAVVLYEEDEDKDEDEGRTVLVLFSIVLLCIFSSSIFSFSIKVSLFFPSPSFA